MKKVLAIVMTVVLLVSFSMAVTAAPSGFVSSPSGNPTPQVEEFKPSNDDCTASLVVTTYGDRENLSDDSKKNIEKAYSDITSAVTIAELCPELETIISQKKLFASSLAVSDLFHINDEGCENHEGHNGFEVTLGVDMLKNFVALLQMNKYGEWEVVPNVKIVNNGKSLKFSVSEFSTYAVVVNNPESVTPRTGDTSNIYLWAAVMFFSAAVIAGIVFFASRKKSSKR